MAPGINEEEGVIRGPMNEDNQRALIEAAAPSKKKKKAPAKSERSPIDEPGEPGPEKAGRDLGNVNESASEGDDEGSPPSNVNEETGQS